MAQAIKRALSGFNFPDYSAEKEAGGSNVPAHYNLPQSPVTMDINRIFGAQGDFRGMAARYNRNPSSHGNTIAHGENGDTIILKFNTGDGEQTFYIPDIWKNKKYNKGTKKMFTYTLIKINEQAYSDGVFRRDFISFPLQELVSIGMYSDRNSARRGFLDSFEPLMGLKIKGETRISKKKTIAQKTISVMFTDAAVDMGSCYVKLNPNLNWDFVATFYTRIPSFYFSLPTKAADLCLYIFSMARQREKKIKEQGYFTINNRSIAQFLGLPDETEVKNPTNAIKKKIEDAIADIEKEIEKNPERGEFKITPVYEEHCSIKDYLDNGYIKVELFGSYAAYFIEGADKRTKGIEAARRKKERIEIEARAKNLAKAQSKAKK